METIMYKGQALLPVKSDIVFKALFGKEENKDLLASLLSSLLDLNIQSPDDIEITNTELAQNYGDDKLNRLDVRIKTKDNQHIDVEVQLINKSDMINRSVYYVSRLYTEQMKEGNRYKDLGKAIALNIIDFNLFEETNYLSRYRFKNVANNKELTDIIELNFLELKKVKQIETNDLKNLWALFLSTQNEEVLDMLSDSNETLNKAVEKLKYVSADDIVRFEYDQRQKAVFDYYSDMKNSREEGIQEGIQKGQYQIAQKAIQEGLSFDMITMLTGLSKEDLEQMEREIKN